MRLGTVRERESHGIRNFGSGLPRRQIRVAPEPLGDLLLEAVFAFEHVFQADQLAVGVGGFDLEHGREDDSFALVVDVGAGLGGFGVLAGSQPAGLAGGPGAIRMGVRSSPLPFWIPVLVLFPGGPQRRERLGPRVAVGVTVGRRVAACAVTSAFPVGGIYPLDLQSVAR